MDKNAVLITTEYRGVFFGFVKDDSKLPEEITLTDARNCIYWDVSVGGFLGLAEKGINSNCKIGSKVKEITLYKITSVTKVSEKALTSWVKYQ